ncbi:hypothetical protein LPW11_02025 [Geomonas sp. RF6]|uniref:hypothetical protein n=1 Tax=Geomonas sp. RF6 TaxID=2897342 RepID=UPI001E61B81E|nr:hypothetical protein [Geomonas sp. RF6]UFS70975.1 hypothetical protein LPW11_02025 [Geomonas sp. RF6]
MRLDERREEPPVGGDTVPIGCSTAVTCRSGPVPRSSLSGSGARSCPGGGFSTSLAGPGCGAGRSTCGTVADSSRGGRRGAAWRPRDASEAGALRHAASEDERLPWRRQEPGAPGRRSFLPGQQALPAPAPTVAPQRLQPRGP